jgi:hypothetical protein
MQTLKHSIGRRTLVARHSAIISVVAIVALNGCPSDDPDPVVDSGASFDASSSDPTPRADSGSEAASASCHMDSECATPMTDPPGCAEAACDTNTGKCIVRSRDGDGDTFRGAKCRTTAGEPIVTGSDCDDVNGRVHPGATEECNNADDDCNGQVDDGVTPAAPGTCHVGVGECGRTGVLLCTAGSWSCSAVAATTTRHSDAPECDGKDYDCNGTVNNGCACTAGQTRPCPGECSPPSIACTKGVWPSCPTPLVKHQWCRDADGDGLGDASNCTTTCDQSAPAGYVATGGRADCDDNFKVLDHEECNGHPDDDCNAATPEPAQTCAACGNRQVACGQLGTCGSLCPPGTVATGDGHCQSTATYGYFSFGQGDHDDLFLGNIPASSGAEGAVGRVETDIGIPVACAAGGGGGCCAGGNTVVANLDCGNGVNRNIVASEFNTGRNTIGLDGCSPGAAVVLHKLDNAWTACASFSCCGCGCARRFYETRMKLTTNACRAP